MQIQKQYKQLAVDFFSRLNDVRFIGQIIFVFIVLLISWSGVKSIQANYGLQKQITSIKEQNGLQSLQDENLKLQNEYYKTNQYLELSARENFGLADAGEQELLVPKNVALDHTVNLTIINGQATLAKTSVSQGNLESWVNFFLHRHSNN